MKKVLLSLIFSFSIVISFAQQNGIQLTVKWSTVNTRYEVYAKPNFTSSSFSWGPSQISVVVPASAPNTPFTITSVGAGVWGNNTNVYAPTAAPSNDFHSVDSNGGAIALTSGVETLIFAFTFSDGQCRDGVRLFVNGSDPNSSAAGMLGGDYSNTIDYGQISKDAYGSNYNNTGTLCNACNITAPELSKQ
jgi:hypothetical protein